MVLCVSQDILGAHGGATHIFNNTLGVSITRSRRAATATDEPPLEPSMRAQQQNPATATTSTVASALASRNTALLRGCAQRGRSGAHTALTRCTQQAKLKAKDYFGRGVEQLSHWVGIPRQALQQPAEPPAEPPTEPPTQSAVRSAYAQLVLRHALSQARLCKQLYFDGFARSVLTHARKGVNEMLVSRNPRFFPSTGLNGATALAAMSEVAAGAKAAAETRAGHERRDAEKQGTTDVRTPLPEPWSEVHVFICQVRPAHIYKHAVSYGVFLACMASLQYVHTRTKRAAADRGAGAQIVNCEGAMIETAQGSGRDVPRASRARQWAPDTAAKFPLFQFQLHMPSQVLGLFQRPAGASHKALALAQVSQLGARRRGLAPGAIDAPSHEADSPAAGQFARGALAASSSAFGSLSLASMYMDPDTDDENKNECDSRGVVPGRETTVSDAGAASSSCEANVAGDATLRAESKTSGGAGTRCDAGESCSTSRNGQAQEAQPLKTKVDAQELAEAMFDSLRLYRKQSELVGSSASESAEDEHVFLLLVRVVLLDVKRYDLIDQYRCWYAEVKRLREMSDALLKRKEMWLPNYRVGGVGAVPLNVVGAAKMLELEWKVTREHRRFVHCAEALEHYLSHCGEIVMDDLRVRPYLRGFVFPLLYQLAQSPQAGDNEYTREVLRMLKEDLQESYSRLYYFWDRLSDTQRDARSSLRSLTQLVLSMPRK